jgi:trimeric autotransporter adhesin
MQSAKLCALFLGLGVSIGLCSCGGGSSSSNNTGSGGGGGGNNTPPPPTISSISPTKITAGSAAFTLTVNGTNFQSNTTIEVGGIVDPTTYVSATKVTANVAAAQVGSGAQLSIVAVNGTSSSAAGTAVNLEVDNPAPTVAIVTPSTAYVGQNLPVIAIAGAGFVPSTVIQVNGNVRPTAFISGTQVDVTLSADDVASGGTLSLKAVNPAPGGGTSTALTVSVTNPFPQVVSLSPESVLTNAAQPVSITIKGNYFVPTSTVQVNQTARATTYVSATQLTFTLSASDLSSTQQLFITVVNPSPGGGTAGGGYLNVLQQTPAPVLSQVTPDSFVVGSADTTIQVSGTNLAQQIAPYNFVSTATVNWNGTALTTLGASVIGQQQIVLAQVPASLLAAIGTASITVTSETSTPATSNALSVSITNPPPPTLTSLYPASGPTNTATAITVYGTGFTQS